MKLQIAEVQQRASFAISRDRCSCAHMRSCSTSVFLRSPRRGGSIQHTWGLSAVVHNGLVSLTHGEQEKKGSNQSNNACLFSIKADHI